jgi:arabinogalactan endo-1,4-beta-galactosidase
MKKTLFLLLAVLLIACQKDSSPPSPAPPANNTPATPTTPIVAPADFVRAVDVSFLPEIEAFQPPYIYLDRTSQAKDLFAILKENGVNTIRVRLWHTPSTPNSGLDEVKAFSSRIKTAGFQLWLDIHYSDTWADPGHQAKPAAWSALNFQTLSDSVYAYTKKVVVLLQPDIIEIGNEINAGFLWPDGSTANAANFTALLKSAIKAVQDLPSPKGKTMIHFAGIDGATAFYQMMASNSVVYDFIGLSYYPYWHGKDLSVVKNSLASLSQAIGKKIIIAETAYPFTLLWNDMTNNPIGLQDQLIPTYPATADGQKKVSQRSQEYRHSNQPRNGNLLLGAGMGGL